MKKTCHFISRAFFLKRKLPRLKTALMSKQVVMVTENLSLLLLFKIKTQFQLVKNVSLPMICYDLGNKHPQIKVVFSRRFSSEKSPNTTVASFFSFFSVRLQSHSDWSTFLTIETTKT